MYVALSIEPCFIDETAEVDPSAKIGPNVSIGAGVKIGFGVRVKESIILDNTVIDVSSAADSLTLALTPGCAPPRPSLCTEKRLRLVLDHL